MSFARYLHEHRDQLVDHRTSPPALRAQAGTEADALVLLAVDRHAARDAALQPATVPADALAVDVDDAAAAGPWSSPRRRRRGDARAAGSSRLRVVRPFFAPSVLADPLPYVEPWERR